MKTGPKKLQKFPRDSKNRRSLITPSNKHKIQKKASIFKYETETKKHKNYSRDGSAKNVYQRLYDDSEVRKSYSKKSSISKESSCKRNKSGSNNSKNDWIIYQKFIKEFDGIVNKIIHTNKEKKLFNKETMHEILLKLGFVRFKHYLSNLDKEKSISNIQLWYFTR